VTLVVGIATVIGAAASVLAIWLTVRAKRPPRSHTSSTLEYYIRYTKDAELDPPLHRDIAPENIVLVEAKTILDPPLRPKLIRRNPYLLFLKYTLQTSHPGSRTPRSDVPRWALGLLASEDAERYRIEWGAHLHQLVEDGELRQARRDRRRLAIGAVTLAVALRVRKVLRKAR
jgi:hypothetical protein